MIITSDSVTEQGYEIKYRGISYYCPQLEKYGVIGYRTDLECARAIRRLIRTGKIYPRVVEGR